MALTPGRIQFGRHCGGYNAATIAWFPPKMMQSLVAAGHTALDAIPSGTPAAVPGPLKHAARVAREAEIIGSEADRQLVSATAAAPVE